MFISDNTKAILLLTAPLLFGKNTNHNEVKLLSNKEYHQLAVYLKNIGKQPADLLSSDFNDILNEYQKLDSKRIELLLNRGFLLSQVLDYWYARNMWVISRADKTYPSRLKTRLGENAPPILYGCGDVNLLNLGGLAVIGSRNINDELITYTQNIAQLSSQAGKMIVSGGAKGADLSAMQGVLQADGFACGVLADSLEKSALNSENRLFFQENRLVLISACDPKSRFTVGNAMQRNKYIYALADIGLVINSDLNKGGTWAGAIEQLDKYQQIPIYLRSTGIQSDGLNALANKGALWWNNPTNTQDFLSIFDLNHQNNNLSNDLLSQSNPNDTHQDATPNKQNNPLKPDEELFLLVKKLIVQHLQEPKKEQELAQLFNVSNSQMKLWLSRLIDDNIVIKQNRPIQYILKNHNRNLELFN